MIVWWWFDTDPTSQRLYISFWTNFGARGDGKSLADRFWRLRSWGKASPCAFSAPVCYWHTVELLVHPSRVDKGNIFIYPYPRGTLYLFGGCILTSSPSTPSSPSTLSKATLPSENPRDSGICAYALLEAVVLLCRCAPQVGISR